MKLLNVRWTEHLTPRDAVALRADLVRIRDWAVRAIGQIDTWLDSLYEVESYHMPQCPSWRKCVNQAGAEWRVQCKGCDDG